MITKAFLLREIDYLKKEHERLSNRVEYLEFIANNPAMFKHGDKAIYKGVTGKETITIINEKEIAQKWHSFINEMIFTRIYYATLDNSEPIKVFEVKEYELQKV